MSYGKVTVMPTQLTSRVWLGSNKHAENLDASFGACLSLGSRQPRNRIDMVDYLYVPILDNGPVTASDFLKCVEFASPYLGYGEKGILIHCDAGRNRSAAIVAGLFVYAECLPDFEKAFAYVKSKRPCAQCNRNVKESVVALLPLSPYWPSTSRSHPYTWFALANRQER